MPRPRNRREQLILDRISNIKDAHGVVEDTAFLRYVYSMVFNTRYDDPRIEDDTVDGSADKGIDIIRIDEDRGQAFVTVLQVKNTHGFGGTNMVQLKDGLDWLFH